MKAGESIASNTQPNDLVPESSCLTLFCTESWPNRIFSDSHNALNASLANALYIGPIVLVPRVIFPPFLAHFPVGDLFLFWGNAFTHFPSSYVSELISGSQKSGVFKIWQINDNPI